MTLTGKTKTLRDKPVSVLYPQEIPHKLTQDCTWISVVRDWPEPKNALGTILNSPYTFNQTDPQIDLTWTTLILVNVPVKAHCSKPTFHIIYHLPSGYEMQLKVHGPSENHTLVSVLLYENKELCLLSLHTVILPLVWNI